MDASCLEGPDANTAGQSNGKLFRISDFFSGLLVVILEDGACRVKLASQVRCA